MFLHLFFLPHTYPYPRVLKVYRTNVILSWLHPRAESNGTTIRRGAAGYRMVAPKLVNPLFAMHVEYDMQGTSKLGNRAAIIELYVLGGWRKICDAFS